MSRLPRNRLEANLSTAIRRLAISGLLSPKIGGPSVMPPQPDGCGATPIAATAGPPRPGPTAIAAGSSILSGSIRRHILSSRTPTLPAVNFASPVGREQTAPLQALTVLNDPVYIEAAHVVGAANDAEVADDPPARVESAASCWCWPDRRSRPSSNACSKLVSPWEMAHFSEDGATAKGDGWFSRRGVEVASELAPQPPPGPSSPTCSCDLDETY